MTDRLQSTNFFECLCTDLGMWATALRQASGKVSVTTNYPPLPAGVTRVDVVMAGAGTMVNLPVTPAADSAVATGRAVESATGTWTYSVNDPPHGWSTWDWPTPTPRDNQLRHFISTVDDLVALAR